MPRAPESKGPVDSWSRTPWAGHAAWAVPGTNRLLHTAKATFPAAPRCCQGGRGVFSRKTHTPRDALLPENTRQTHRAVCLSSSSRLIPRQGRAEHSVPKHGVPKQAGTAPSAARWAHPGHKHGPASPLAADTQQLPGDKELTAPEGSLLRAANCSFLLCYPRLGEPPTPRNNPCRCCWSPSAIFCFQREHMAKTTPNLSSSAHTNPGG